MLAHSFRCSAITKVKAVLTRLLLGSRFQTVFQFLNVQGKSILPRLLHYFIYIDLSNIFCFSNLILCSIRGFYSTIYNNVFGAHSGSPIIHYCVITQIVTHLGPLIIQDNGLCFVCQC